ncbi:MAG TPA: hypothetical protein VN153_02575 [Tahibacter sp.]|nr:hypothetical protein [Tahibacter sp.]
MPDYRLQLLIDPSVLPILRATGQRITLARPVNSHSSPSVIWLSFDPLQNCDVRWREEFGIYASTTAVQQGASIAKLSEIGAPVQDGASYSLTATATFNGPSASGGAQRGTYTVKNDLPYQDYPVLTFGLTQSVQVNQVQAVRKPISATPVLSTQMAHMVPFPTVSIWLQSTFPSETIITRIVGRPSVARFGDGVTDLTLKYDPNLGVFAPQPGLAKEQSEHPHVEPIPPLLY